ncbi:VanZ family protein [Paenibacillus sedimenti]|nr:VanZ family protein [Paenibacillus sedimenti]
MYVLFKIILFKFDFIDINFLWHQLQMNLGNPDYSMHRLGYPRLRFGINFMPLKTISDTFLSPSRNEVINLVGNILVFMPYGIFLQLLPRSRMISHIRVFCRSLGLSLLLECLQVVFSIGSFDVDDLILNTFGGLLGFGIFKLYSKYIVIKQLKGS